MKYRYLILLTVLAAGTCHAGAAVDPTTLLAQSAHNMQAGRLAGWSYDRTTRMSGTTYEHFNPIAPAKRRWTLISINGDAPTPAETAAYDAGRNPLTGKRLAKGIDGRPSGIVGSLPGHLGSLLDRLCIPLKRLQPTSITARTVSFSFQADCRPYLAHLQREIRDAGTAGARPKKLQRELKNMQIAGAALNHVSGIVTVSRRGPYIQSLDMNNRKPFSISLVTINHFHNEADYGPPGPGAPAVLKHAVISVQGKAFFFMAIHKRLSVTFGDFQRAAATSSQPHSSSSGP